MEEETKKSIFGKTQKRDDMELVERAGAVKSTSTTCNTASTTGEMAVCVRYACKRYADFTKSVIVLDKLHMTVYKGTIYGLLGASGSGKTTLLSCILGCAQLNAGSIWVLGGKPGGYVSGVPGARVGYMPQTTALYGDFTVRETFAYYGQIVDMTSSNIQKRFEFLTDLLKLPPKNEFVRNLSGGQQRRLSLSMALLHEPELLILDEPTVGLDPLVRQTIWEHLVGLAKNAHTTIILTTHYIEEARQADVVGLLRGGRFLAEGPPDELIQSNRAQNLEEVYLKLSLQQNTSTVFANAPYPPPLPIERRHVPGLKDYLPDVKGHRTRAHVRKGFLWMWRNLFAMFCVIMLPVTQIPTLYYAIGNDPVDLNVAMVNYETNNSLYCNKTVSCYNPQLSCGYMDYLEGRGLNLIYYESEENARDSVLKGHTYASIVVTKNYTAALVRRIDLAEFTSPYDITASEIQVFRDVSNKHIAIQLQIYLYDTFLHFVQDYIVSCGHLRRALAIPVKWETPIYGEQYPSFRNFAFPGIFVTLTFFLAVAASALGLLVDRKEGGIERAFTIGITRTELLLAHVVCQTTIMVVQSVMTIIFAFVIFDFPQNGSYIVLLIHTLLTGYAGMGYGLLISCLCDRETTAIFVAVGSVFSMLMLCGVIWPVEALSLYLQPIAYVLPFTKATESLRSILERGWGLSHPIVFTAFISIGNWIVLFFAISIILLKYKKIRDI